MIALQIIGIRKPGGIYNDPRAISHYQWRDSSGRVDIWDRMTLIRWLLQDRVNRSAYVRDRSGDIAYCKIMKSPVGTWFLETYPDYTRADNLLSLPEI